VPIYEYRCDDCGVSVEVLQRMSDDPLETCEQCGGHLRRVLHPVAIHFKGSGFYTTDYGKGSRRPGGGSDESSSTGGAEPVKSRDDKAAEKAAKPAEKKTSGDAGKAGTAAKAGAGSKKTAG
jgi:putative FmdB family regulatory protein